MNSFAAEFAVAGAAGGLGGLIIFARACLLLPRDRRQGNMGIDVLFGFDPVLRFALSWLRCKFVLGVSHVIGIGPIRDSRHTGTIQQDLFALARGSRLKATFQQGLAAGAFGLLV